MIAGAISRVAEHARRNVVAYLALAFAIGGASAYAATSLVGPGGAISGCVRKDGVLRVVPRGKHCAKGEHGLSFNQRGAPGLQGTQGSPGVGQPGAPGAAGNTILNGSGAPAANIGAPGDFDIDTVGQDLYGPKTTNGWGSAVHLVGPQGNPGAPALSGFETVNDHSGTVPAGNIGSLGIQCPAGKTAISGGYAIPYGATALEDHARISDATIWDITAAFPSSSGVITGYVQCANVK